MVSSKIENSNGLYQVFMSKDSQRFSIFYFSAIDSNASNFFSQHWFQDKDCRTWRQANQTANLGYCWSGAVPNNYNWYACMCLLLIICLKHRTSQASVKLLRLGCGSKNEILHHINFRIRAYRFKCEHWFWDTANKCILRYIKYISWFMLPVILKKKVMYFD